MKILDTVFVYRLIEGKKLAWHGRYHSHKSNEYEIHYFLEGEGSFLSNRTRYSLSSNTLFLSGPHEFHSIVPQKVTKPITYYAVLFSVDESLDFELCQLLTSILQRAKKCLAPDVMNRCTFEEIMRLSLSRQDAQKISAAFLLGSHLYRWYADVWNGQSKDCVVPETQTKEDGTALAHAKKAISIMQKNMHRAFLIEDLAWQLGLSTEHFIRLFKNEMKITPHQYSIRLRIQSAAEELLGTSKTVGRIASELSFENQFHFSRVFKKCTGFTPTAYRRCYTDVTAIEFLLPTIEHNPY